jgi:hypothetical protein
MADARTCEVTATLVTFEHMAVTRKYSLASRFVAKIN